MTFRVGQKVVCVDASPSMGPVPLVKGAIYIVAATGLVHPIDPTEKPCIQVKEVATWHAFWTHRFRPIVECKTDITVFTEILRKATKPARSPLVALQP